MSNEIKIMSKLDKTICLWLMGGQGKDLRFKRPSPPAYNKAWEWFIGLKGDAFAKAACAIRLRSKAYRQAGVPNSTLSAEYALNDLGCLLSHQEGEEV